VRIDWIVVGAGFTGATLAERIAVECNACVLVVDRRPHIAGNAYDAPDGDGLLRHRYGPHIFHTNSEKVWRYLQRFSAWRPYFHRVRAVVDGRQVPLPFNLDSIETLFPRAMADRLQRTLLAHFRFGERVPILKLMREGEGELAELARFLYEKVFRNYALKQWGLPPEELSPSETARVSILVSRDDRYFQDRWQAMPAEGYTALIGRMLDHPNIRVLLRTDFREVRPLFPAARVIYTGPIDEYFGRRFGALPYRSLRFEWQTLPVERHQEVGTVNYPEEYDFTRITEMKHLTGQASARTALLMEYPQAHQPDINEPYYPIPGERNQALYSRYEVLAREEKDVIFCGRLGNYKHYSMDQAVAAALTVFDKIVNKTDRHEAGSSAPASSPRATVTHLRPLNLG
jgi:UDP-galactopyranose mutase